jgi:hypothetical protein
MALETLKGVTEIGGFKVLQERPKKPDGSVDWPAFDELRKTQPIYVDHDVNMISFRIQQGPVKEAGVNGCQVDTLIEAAVVMLRGLNRQFPCPENISALADLRCALDRLDERRKNREARGVEGTSQA